jgi:hypothetical protein
MGRIPFKEVVMDKASPAQTLTLFAVFVVVTGAVSAVSIYFPESSAYAYIGIPGMVLIVGIGLFMGRKKPT